MSNPAELTSLFDDSPIEPGRKSSPPPKPVPVTASPAMTCPNCGFEQEEANECLRCGVVVAKFRDRQSRPGAPGQAELPPLPEVRSQEEIQAELSGAGYVPRERVSETVEDDGIFAPERRGLDKGILGGAVMMLIAVVWFALGWAAGYIFYYPPVLFVIGLFGLVKGLLTGNVSG